MKDYDPKEIEKKWQEEWERGGVYEAQDPETSLFKKSKPKWYSLIEFPYPSGDGLHVGHIRSYTAMDIVSRKRRMEGYNVLYPIGWDAFGLPAENYAIKTGIHPSKTTRQNTDNFRKQMKSLGLSFDFSREVNTTDPKYYKWTQWIFLKFLEKGLAYKAKMPINWCPKDKIGLANEEVVDGKCERCGTPVEQRLKEQWMLKITAYAERLLKDLKDLDFQDRIKAQQINWIGESEGAEIEFEVKGSAEKIKVFTTRPDTIFGATFLVKSGKSDKFTGQYAVNPATKEEIPIWEAEYVLSDYGTGVIMAVPAHDDRDFEFAKKHDLPIKEVVMERVIDEGNPHVADKKIVFRDGVIVALRDPKTNKYMTLKWKKYPWVTFVMGGIDDGEDPEVAAIREIREETGYKNVRLIKRLRDAQSEFFAAHKDLNRVAHTRNFVFELIDDEHDEISEEESAIHELSWVSLDEIKSGKMTHSEIPIFVDYFNGVEKAYDGIGILMNSGKFDGRNSQEIKKEITEFVGGRLVTRYKLRDWVFSRQRYWGEPIPVIFCNKCGTVPVPEKDLPVTLPQVENYQPTDTGESPLANIQEWVNTTCPLCGGKAKRETDVMPNWAGSSWYFLRYVDPENDKELSNKKKLRYWMPVDWYNGGMEHTTLHLLYSRFWNKFLFDIGAVSTEEPYKKRTSHGVILASDGKKMSKSLGNVVNPDDVIKQFGADTLRLYEMFMGPFEQMIAWNSDSLVGPRRFLERVWRLCGKIGEASVDDFRMHSTIKKVSEDIEAMGFNTAVSTMMIWVNELDSRESIARAEYETLLRLLAPFTPHITEELWRELGSTSSVHKEEWPKHDENKLIKDEITYVIQVDGKVRSSITVSTGVEKDELEKEVLELQEVIKWVEGKEIKKIIVVPQKVVNIVTS